MTDLLIRNVRPMGGAPADILIRGGRIEAIGAGLAADGVAVEDGGEDLRAAREPTGLGGGDPVAGEVVAGHQAGADEVGSREVGQE